MAGPYFLHQYLYNPDADPDDGLFADLLNQERYPELFKMSKIIGSRQYWDMATVENLSFVRANWSSIYFSYPLDVTRPLVALDNLYATAVTINPETKKNDYYYDPRRIQIFLALVDKQREFCYQFMNSYLYRTKTHQETMYNRLYDAERFTGVVAGVWGVARNYWMKMPALT